MEFNNNKEIKEKKNKDGIYNNKYICYICFFVLNVQ